MPESQIVVRPNPDGSHMGSDLSAVNAARRSFAKRSEYIEDSSGWRLPDKDKRLINYLARGMTQEEYEDFLHKLHHKLHQLDVEDAEHMYDDDYSLDYSKLEELLWKFRDTPEHDTPFNHMFMSFEVQAPIFVRSHLGKHEYLIMSEFSRRYITDNVEFYEHDYREAPKSKKQGSGGVHPKSEEYKKEVLAANLRQVELYNSLIERGVSPEQARGVLPQDLMTSWTWSGSFGAFAKMIRLRMAEDTQYETRLVANQIAKYAKEWFPLSYKALVERDFE